MLKQPRTWLDWARFYLHAFRLVVVTVCLGLAVYGWFGHIGWLYAGPALSLAQASCSNARIT